MTILTPGYGKLRVMAKSARKMTSRKAGHIELFAHTQLFMARGRTFDLITQAELIDPHLQLREDMLRGGLAHYVGELVDQFAQEEHEDAALFDAACEAMRLLCSVRDPLLAARYVELRLLQLSGYRPQLQRCVVTGEVLEVDVLDSEVQTTPFSPTAGGVLTRPAAAYARDVVMLSHSGLLLLRALQTQPYAALDELSIPRDVHMEIERAMQLYVSFVTERRMRVPGVLKRVGE